MARGTERVRVHADIFKNKIHRYSGLGQITAVFSALFWGGLFKYFSAPDAHLHPWWLRWGPGGHFMMTTTMMLGAQMLLKTANPATLFLEESERKRPGCKTKTALPRKNQ